MTEFDRAVALLKAGAIDLDGFDRMLRPGPGTAALNKGFFSMFSNAAGATVGGFSALKGAVKTAASGVSRVAGPPVKRAGRAIAGAMGRTAVGRGALKAGSTLGRAGKFAVKHSTGLGLAASAISGLGSGYLAYREMQRRNAGSGIASDRSYRRRSGGVANSSPF